MGNNQQRYLTNTEALETLGSETWSTINKKFEITGTRYVDYQLFSNILLSSYPRMVRIFKKCALF